MYRAVAPRLREFIARTGSFRTLFIVGAEGKRHDPEVRDEQRLGRAAFGHEYQFLLDTTAGREALSRILAFLARRA